MNRILFSTMASISRVAVITGAARGIGRAIALRLAKDGLNVVVNDLPRMRNELEDVASEIKSLRRESLAVYGDASSEDDVKRLMVSAVKQFGSLDVVCSFRSRFPSFKLH